MKCPQCDSQLSDRAACCSNCGFNALTSSARHGDHLVRLERLTDAAHCISLRDRRKLEARLDDFERRFPQVFLAVYFGVLPQGLRVAEVGFWLLNHAAFGTHDISKRNEFGIVIVVDPAASTACFSLGYAVEALADQIKPVDILERMRGSLTLSHYAGAVEKAVCLLDRRLRSAGKPQIRDCNSTRIHTVSSDLGLSPLRAARQADPHSRKMTANLHSE